MLLDLNKDEKISYKFLSQTIVPRPIAWVVTEGEGINIAPFSFFMGVSIKPATVMFCIRDKEDGTPKDTKTNILKNKKCTICSTPASCLELVDETAEELEYGNSEAKKFGIDTKIVKDGFPPIISDSKSAMFCELDEIIDVKIYKMFMFKVVEAFVEDSAITNKDRFTIELDNLARVGHSYKKLV